MPYAEIGDLCCPVADEGKAKVLLERASVIIRSKCGGEPADAAAARAVCAAMVERVLPLIGSDSFGVTQSTTSVDSFSQSYMWSNPSGDLYMTQTEQEALGIGVGQCGFASWGGE